MTAGIRTIAFRILITNNYGLFVLLALYLHIIVTYIIFIYITTM